MKLYLAVAVLMLAFVAYTEAQEETMEERFNQFGQQVKDLATTTAEKVKVAMEDFHKSEHVQNAKNWFQERFQELQKKFS